MTNETCGTCGHGTRKVIACTTDTECDSHHGAFEPAILGGGDNGRTANVCKDDNRE